MKIDKNIPIKANNAVQYGTIFWQELTSKIKPGESTLIKVNDHGAAKARSILDCYLRKSGLTQKFSFKRWDSENYRVWRVL